MSTNSIRLKNGRERERERERESTSGTKPTDRIRNYEK